MFNKNLCLVSQYYHLCFIGQAFNMSQEVENVKALLTFNTPSAVFLAAPTMGGKSTLMFGILKNASGCFQRPPDKIVYAYRHFQPLFREMIKSIPNIIMFEGLPTADDIEDWSKGTEHMVLVLDDMIAEVVKDAQTLSLFTMKCHHMCITVFLLSQHLFFPGKFSRSISLNIHYFLIFKNPRDRKQALYFASQPFPDSLEYVKSALAKAHSKPYGYLCIDLSPSTPEEYRLRTNILPGEVPIVYLPKSSQTTDGIYK